MVSKEAPYSSLGDALETLLRAQAGQDARFEATEDYLRVILPTSNMRQ